MALCWFCGEHKNPGEEHCPACGARLYRESREIPDKKFRPADAFFSFRKSRRGRLSAVLLTGLLGLSALFIFLPFLREAHTIRKSYYLEDNEPTRKIQSEISYRKWTARPVRDGPTRIYYRNGRIMAEAFFENGMLEGEKTLYYPDGQVESRSHYHRDFLEGTWRRYYPDGTLAGKGEFERGSGKVELVDRAGRIRAIETYEKGELSGTRKWFHPGGLQILECFFKNGVPAKPCRGFDRDGEPAIGTVRAYYEKTGELAAEFFFDEKHRPHGDYTIYYEDGTVMEEGSFSHGWHQGLRTTYYPSGQVEETAHFIKGKPDGELVSYTPGGQIRFRLWFENGELRRREILI